jgi:hypothetical protein
VSYEELPQHAARIQQLAIQESLKQKGWLDIGHGELRAPADVGEQAAKDIVAYTEQEFSGTAGMFEPFLTMPDPGQFDPMLQDLRAARNMLSSGQASMDPVNKLVVTANLAMEGMTTVGKNVQDWRGAAAAAFKQNFVEPFPAITANQFALVATLNGAMEAERALWDECRKNVDDIAHKAIMALEVMDECSPDDQVCILTVASSVFAVAAVLTTGGAAIALTVAGAAAQAAGGVPRDEPPKVQFDGQTPQAILKQVQDGLDKLADVTNRKEKQVAEAMTASASTLAANKSRFVSPRPSLADATASTVTGPSGLGEAV